MTSLPIREPDEGVKSARESESREGEAPAEPGIREGEAPAEPRIEEEVHRRNREGEAPAEPRSLVKTARQEPRPPEPRSLVKTARQEPRPPDPHPPEPHSSEDQKKSAGSILRWPERAAIATITALIWIYQRTLSPLLGPACRFEPSCSRYMVQALRKYGLFRGLAKGLKRFLSCHPWNPGGYDPP